MCKCQDNLKQELEEARPQLQELAEVLRDLYNDCGNIEQVDKAFNKVYYIVKEYA